MESIKCIFLVFLILLSFSCKEEQKEVKKPVKKPEIIKFKKDFTNSIGMKFVYIKPGTRVKLTKKL